MVPNGVFSSRPPAMAAPFGLVWQATQSPRRATYSPRLISSADAVGAAQALAQQASMPRSSSHMKKKKAGGRREPRCRMEMAFMVTLYYWGQAYAFVTTANIGNFFRATR